MSHAVREPRGPHLTRRRLLAGVSGLALLSALRELAADGSPAGAEAEAFIDRLLARMTPEEKAGQLSLFADPAGIATHQQINPDAGPKISADIARRVRQGQISGLFNGTGTPRWRELQRLAVEESRLGIPLIFGGDVLHGFTTVFPIPLGEAASFDPALAERTARAAAVEATAQGYHWTFAPMVDIGRDQRWGRVAEGAGEDPYLGAQFAAARVRGFQGRALTDDDSLLACPKHFAGYGAALGGMEYNSAEMSEQTLREVYLPPFKAAFDAGAGSTMSGFNDLNGVPMTAHRGLLTGVLRDEWNFAGLVVSDYTADRELIEHGVARDERDAARLSILAGVDLSMQSDLYNQHLPALMAGGEVPAAVVDTAVRRVLRIKHRLGLFTNPYRSLDPARALGDDTRAQIRALARRSAHASMVLLKNEASVLPLRAGGQRLALIGPFGDDTRHLAGPWAPFADLRHEASLAQALRTALGASAALQVVRGCDVEQAVPGGLEAAVAAARTSDVVLLALGESQDMSGEAASRTDIGLPPAQQALAEAVIATGTPVVVVLRNGRALALRGAVRDARALLVTWFLGSQTGPAIADVLLGVVSPSGRLPVSFPQASGQQPFFYGHRRTGRPQVSPQDPYWKTRYRDTSHEALYPFGHGLSYSTFRYGEVDTGGGVLPWDGSITLSATITNTGTREAEETAQLYVHDRVASLTRPVRELKGFHKLRLQPGQSATVRFTLSRADLGFYDAAMRWVTEPGEFDAWIAPSATAGRAQRFELRAEDEHAP